MDLKDLSWGRVGVWEMLLLPFQPRSFGCFDDDKTHPFVTSLNQAFHETVSKKQKQKTLPRDSLCAGGGVPGSIGALAIFLEAYLLQEAFEELHCKCWQYLDF